MGKVKMTITEIEKKLYDENPIICCLTHEFKYIEPPVGELKLQRVSKNVRPTCDKVEIHTGTQQVLSKFFYKITAVFKKSERANVLKPTKPPRGLRTLSFQRVRGANCLVRLFTLQTYESGYPDNNHRFVETPSSWYLSKKSITRGTTVDLLRTAVTALRELVQTK